MFTKDLKAHLTVTVLCQPAVVTTTQTSEAFDTQEYEGDFVLLQSVGARTTGNVTTKIQDSADGADDWQDVSGVALAAVSASNTLSTLKVDKRACRRYIRTVATGADTPNYALAILIAGQLKRQ